MAVSDKRRVKLINSKRMAKLRRRRIWLRVMLLTGFAALTALLVLLSPYFYITKFEISGLARYSEADIKKAAGFDSVSYDSIFFKLSSDIEKGIKSLPYVRDAAVKKLYPDTLEITVVERKARGYVEYQNMGQYLYIDEDGVVLDVKSSLGDNLPVIVGLEFQTFSLGKTLETHNKDAFDNMVKLSALFAKYDISGVVKVDVSDNSGIHVFINNVDVSIGTIEMADEKIMTAKEILENHLDKSVRGTLHVENLVQDPYFGWLK